MLLRHWRDGAAGGDRQRRNGSTGWPLKTQRIAGRAHDYALLALRRASYAFSMTYDVTHRVATPRSYLMCPPEYFDVTYAINPWMRPDAPVDPEVAMRQWAALRATYEALGHAVSTIEPAAGLPDMVFAANGATVIDGTVLGVRFRHAERAPAAAAYMS